MKRLMAFAVLALGVRLPVQAARQVPVTEIGESEVVPVLEACKKAARYSLHYLSLRVDAAM